MSNTDNRPCDECNHTNWTFHPNPDFNCQCLCHVPAIVTKEDMDNGMIQVPKEFHDFFSAYRNTRSFSDVV